MRISDWSSDVCSSDLLRLVAGIAADHKIGAAGQGPAQRFPGVAAHNDGVPKRRALEVRKIGRQAPWQGVVAPNDAICRVGDDQLYGGRIRAIFDGYVHTATAALI